MTEKLEAPNHTQIPNAILGDIAKGNKVIPGLMASLEGSELKVLLAVCRLTFGFHQTSRRASLTMIEQLTGLSRQGVVNAAAALTSKGLIEREYDGGVTLWKVVVNSVDYPDIYEVVNSVDYLVNSVDQASQLSGLPSKKETRKKPEKETGGIPPAKIQLAPIPAALAELCRIKPELMTNGLAHEVQESTTLLTQAGVTPDQIRAFGAWWYAHDWRGKRNEAPKPRQVCETWGQFEDTSDVGGGKQRGFTPEQLEAIRVREQESEREQRQRSRQ